MRFKMPLTYLNHNIMQELLKMQNSWSMWFHSLIRQRSAKVLEKALIATIHRQNQLFNCLLSKVKIHNFQTQTQKFNLINEIPYF